MMGKIIRPFLLLLCLSLLAACSAGGAERCVRRYYGEDYVFQDGIYKYIDCFGSADDDVTRASLINITNRERGSLTEASLVEGVKITAPKKCSPGAESLTVTLENTGSAGICYGDIFHLEKHAGGDWITVNADMAFASMLHTLEPGQTEEIVYPLTSLGSGDVRPEIDNGEYRLIFDIDDAAVYFIFSVK